MLESETRFTVTRSDPSTYVVVDAYTNIEFCVCSDYEGSPSSRQRAHIVAKLLNDNWTSARQLINHNLGLE